METNPVVASATSTEVLLDDCAIENLVEYDEAGHVVGTAENAAFSYSVTVVDEGGVWKVSDFARRQQPCVPADGRRQRRVLGLGCRPDGHLGEVQRTSARMDAV